jgi:hypothetical protein
MAENNTPGIPQEWITVKTLKTISGASLCCWLTTVFFDLICFMPVTDVKLHALLVLIVSAVSCLGLAIYKVSSSRGKRTKVLWMLVIPNAMLIYIHALGFQVATKELAIRASANEIKKQEIQAGMSSFFNFFAKQTSWIPSLELTKKTKEVEVVQQSNKILKDSIVNLKETQQDIPVNNNSLPAKADSSSYYFSLYRNCVTTNITLKNRVDSFDLRTRKLLQDVLQQESAKYRKTDSILVKRIGDKNSLINKWNQIMGSGSMTLQKAEIERIMEGHMGDENYYKKLFRPISVQ